MKDCCGGGAQYRHSIASYHNVIVVSDVQLCSHGVTHNGIGMYRDGMAWQDLKET